MKRPLISSKYYLVDTDKNPEVSNVLTRRFGLSDTLEIDFDHEGSVDFDSEGSFTLTVKVQPLARPKVSGLGQLGLGQLHPKLACCG